MHAISSYLQFRVIVVTDQQTNPHTDRTDYNTHKVAASVYIMHPGVYQVTSGCTTEKCMLKQLSAVV